MSTEDGPVLHLACQRRGLAPLPFNQLPHWFAKNGLTFHNKKKAIFG